MVQGLRTEFPVPPPPPSDSDSDSLGAAFEDAGPEADRGRSLFFLPPKLYLMESTFSSPAEAALQREAGAAGVLTPLADLDRVYELERVAGFVRDLECQRVRADWGGVAHLWMGRPEDRDLGVIL